MGRLAVHQATGRIFRPVKPCGTGVRLQLRGTPSLAKGRVRAEKPKTLAELKAILDDFQPSSGQAFFPGGADDTLMDALEDAGWQVKWLEGDYFYTATQSAGVAITYVEGASTTATGGEPAAWTPLSPEGGVPRLSPGAPGLDLGHPSPGALVLLSPYERHPRGARGGGPGLPLSADGGS